MIGLDQRKHQVAEKEIRDLDLSRESRHPRAEIRRKVRNASDLRQGQDLAILGQSLADNAVPGLLLDVENLDRFRILDVASPSQCRDQGVASPSQCRDPDVASPSLAAASRATSLGVGLANAEEGRDPEAELAVNNRVNKNVVIVHRLICVDMCFIGYKIELVINEIYFRSV